MASAAEQLAANINFGAIAKAEDLKKRIWFTLGALLVYRLGTYIPIPGIDPVELSRLVELGEHVRDRAQELMPEASVTARPRTRARRRGRIQTLFLCGSVLVAVGAGLPATAVALWLLWTGTLTPRLQWTLSVTVVGSQVIPLPAWLR